jgi:hypothetical protein
MWFVFLKNVTIGRKNIGGKRGVFPDKNELFFPS